MDLKMEVYTPALELIGFLEIQKSVIWEEKAFSTGSFSVESIITNESLVLLQEENIIWIEGETAGIIEYANKKTDKSGPYISVKGRTLTGILDRRVLWGLYNLKGTVPEIMHALVNDCCVNPTRGDVEARKIPGLVLLAAPAGGAEVQFQKTGGSLLETLEQLGETYGVAFGVRFNPAVPQMEFWTRWGENKSIYQAANSPVLYSTELDDVLSSEYLYNSQDYRNVALVAGEGEGKDRVYVTVENESEDPDVPAPPTPPEPPVIEQYTVTLLVDPAGGGIASGGKTVAAGVSITVAALPSEGYEFSGWQENGVTVSTSASYTFTVTANRTLTAVFSVIIPTYTISASIDPSGSGTVTGAGKYKEGETVTLKATAGDGYKFTEWRENGVYVHSGEEYTFTASKDVSLTAVFSVKKPSRLPDGYTEVEYIQSGGTQFIDTGKCPSATFKISVDISVDTTPPSNVYILYSSYSVSATTRYVCYAQWATSAIRVATGSVGNTITWKNITTNVSPRRVLFSIDYPNKIASIGNEASISLTSTSAYSVSSAQIRLLGSGQYNISAKLYSVKIEDKDGDMDFVPCIDPSGQVGLYDLVGGAFYGNAGTGTFTAGPAV